MIEYVYFITLKGRVNEPMKIGVSYDIAQRIRQLESPMPFKLECVEYVELPEGWAYRVEKALHRHFHRRRIKNEWFDIRKEDILPAMEVVAFNLGLGDPIIEDHKGIIPKPGRPKYSTAVGL
jgi:hypothetical protein